MSIQTHEQKILTISLQGKSLHDVKNNIMDEGTKFIENIVAITEKSSERIAADTDIIIPPFSTFAQNLTSNISSKEDLLFESSFLLMKHTPTSLLNGSKSIHIPIFNTTENT